MAMEIAGHISEIAKRLDIPYVFKGSYRKANRSRVDSFTGIGDIKALEILKKVHDTFQIPVVTDIHSAEEAEMAAQYVDVLQIPAFLCRQTELLVAAAKTGKMVNIKKGQFLSPEAMEFAVQKVKDSGNNDVAITERGTTFGYQDLIVDYRGIPTMKQFAPSVPVYVDTLGVFEDANPQIPSGGELHTFLLDRDDNVLLVGNPIWNEKIEEMFWQIVEERLGKNEMK